MKMKSLLLLLSLPASLGIAVGWWRLWMYHGLFGPPPLLKPFFSLDGEAVYDRVLGEMFVVAWILALSSILIWFRRRESGTLTPVDFSLPAGNPKHREREFRSGGGRSNQPG